MFILAAVIDYCVGSNIRLIGDFLDLVAAFDSVSHPFLDEALGEQGASAKSRMMVRAIYRKATAVVRVSTKLGAQVRSRPFKIVQLWSPARWPITSPIHHCSLSDHEYIPRYGITRGVTALRDSLFGTDHEET